MSQSVGPLFDKQLTMSFPADIPVDLEGMFRRGPQWETGVEHIFVVEVGLLTSPCLSSTVRCILIYKESQVLSTSSKQSKHFLLAA